MEVSFGSMGVAVISVLALEAIGCVLLLLSIMSDGRRVGKWLSAALACYFVGFVVDLVVCIPTSTAMNGSHTSVNSLYVLGFPVVFTLIALIVHLYRSRRWR